MRSRRLAGRVSPADVDHDGRENRGRGVMRVLDDVQARAPAARAIGYVRMASDEQSTHGSELDAQQRAVGDYCRREGLELVELFADSEVPGSSALEDRPGLASALRAVRDGRAGVLVAARLDRIAPSTLGALLIERDFEEAGCAVVYAESLNGDEPELRMMRTVMHALAEADRGRLVKRLAEGKRDARRAGQHVDGFAPFGYHRDESGRLTPRGLTATDAANATDEDETSAAAIVRRIFRGARRGLSPGRIADGLNADGLASPTGKPWNRQTVRNVITSRVYRGELHGRPDAHPAVVAPALWDAANAALRARGRAVSSTNYE